MWTLVGQFERARDLFRAVVEVVMSECLYQVIGSTNQFFDKAAVTAVNCHSEAFAYGRDYVFGCKTRYRLLTAFVCIGCLMFMLHPEARSKERDDKGFVPLFNGHDLSGWQTTGNWVFEPGGVLALKPKYRGLRLFPDYKSFLWSKASYDDFVLDLEFKVAKNGSSGVFLRSSSRRSYIQAQIRDSHGKEGPLGDGTCGAVVGVAAPSKNMSKPAGQWNRMIITCEGNRMQVQLNGEEVINLDLHESQKTRTVRSGRIGFENTNSPVAFRNVRIKELRRDQENGK